MKTKLNEIKKVFDGLINYLIQTDFILEEKKGTSVSILEEVRGVPIRYPYSRMM
jgi:hypothetical protein